jgi:hypothetical protein
MPCQYPQYYGSLYYPQYHLSDFHDSDTICQWSLTRLDLHHVSCMSCPHLSLSVTAVQFHKRGFTISVGDLLLSLSILDIKSAMFSFCQLAQQFVKLLVSLEWLHVAEFVLSQNPSWLNCPEGLILVLPQL